METNIYQLLGENAACANDDGSLDTLTSGIPDIGFQQTFNKSNPILIDSIFESFELTVKLNHTQRGALTAWLIPPSGRDKIWKDHKVELIAQDISVNYGDQNFWVKFAVDATTGERSCTPLHNGVTDDLENMAMARDACMDSDDVVNEDALDGVDTIGLWTFFICDNDLTSAGMVQEITFTITGNSLFPALYAPLFSH